MSLRAGHHVRKLWGRLHDLGLQVSDLWLGCDGLQTVPDESRRALSFIRQTQVGRDVLDGVRHLFVALPVVGVPENTGSRAMHRASNSQYA